MAAEQKKSLTKRILFPLISITLSLLIALLIGEFAVRKLHLSKTWSSYIDRDELMQKITSEKKIGFTRIPNSSFEAPRHIIYKANADGFRDKEHSKEITSHKIRIAFIGDSVTEGFGVEEENRFSNLAEKKLNEVNASFEVLNFGIAGYATMDELEILKSEVLSYHPDYIFLQMNLNDFGRNIHLKKLVDNNQLNEVKNNPEKNNSNEGSGVVNWLQNHSALYLYIAETYNYNKLRSGKTNAMSPSENSVSYDEWNETIFLLSQMDSLCAASQSKFILSYIPLAAEVVIQNDSLGNIFNLKLKNFCEAHPINYCDVTFSLRKSASPDNLFLDDCHLSIEGNKMVAEKLFEYFQSLIRN